MSKKREKRIAQLNKDYEDAVIEQSLTKSFESVKNEDLFVVDREGSAAKRKKVIKELLPKATNTFISPTEQKIINKYIKKGFPSQIKKRYGQDIVEISPSSSSSKKRKAGKIAETPLGDLWEEEGKLEIPPLDAAGSKEAQKKKMRVALPGQSYHPNPKDHQNLVAEAVAIEMKLQQASNPENTSNNNKALIPSEYSVNNFYLQNQTAKDITNLLLSNTANQEDDDDDEDEESDDSNSSDSDEDEEKEGDQEDGDGEDGKKRKKAKVPEKVTRAQLNKRKAQRIAKHEKDRIKAQENLDKSIDQLKIILSDLKNQEEINEFQKQMKKLVKRKKLRQLEKKAISLSERKQRLRSSIASQKKKENKVKGDKEGVREEQEEENDADDVFEDDEDTSNQLKPSEISSIPLSDELNSSLRKVIPKGVAVKDYMFEMIDNGYMNPKRKKGFSIKDHPYLAKKVKWIPKYKY